MHALKNISFLITSNIFGTIILAAGTLLISQMVSPSEFGKYAYAAQAAISIYPVLTLRYEYSIPLMRDKKRIKLLIFGCFVLLTFITLLLILVGIIGLSFPFISIYIPNDLIDQFPLIVLGAFALGLSSIVQIATLTRGAVYSLGLSRIVRAIAMVLAQVLFIHSVGSGASWLLLGEVSANFVHAAFLAVALGFGRKIIFPRISWKNILKKLFILGIRYKEFPLITLPHMLSHSALGFLFATVLGAVYGATALGQYYLMRKMVFGVLGLFVTAVHQHSLAEAARVPRDMMRRVALQALALIGSVTIFSAGMILVWGAGLFTRVVGNSWEMAGAMAVASVPLILAEPVASTFSFLPAFLRVQHAAFAVALVQGFLGISAIGIAGWMGLDVVTALVSASFATATVMSLYVLWLLKRA